MPGMDECIARFQNDPGVDDPGALCAWMEKTGSGWFAGAEGADLDAAIAAFKELGSPVNGEIVIPKIHIMTEGTWQGDHYGPKEFQEMCENFRKFSTGPNPLVENPAVVGHEEEQIDFTGVPAVGWVKRLYCEGPDLFADVSQVFPPIARLIEAGAYKHVSPEIYPPDHLPEGVEGARGHMLRRVAFLGGELPHLKSIADLPDPVRLSEYTPRPALRVTLHPSGRLWDATAGAWACFSEVRQMADDATTQIAEQAIRDAYPDLPDELIQSFTPEQLSILAGSMAGQGAPSAPEEAPGMEASPGEAEPGSVEMQDDLGGDLGAAGAAPGRDEMITQLVGVGEDPAALQAMSDEDLLALYQQRIGMEAGEGAMPMAEVLS